jgi:hypothetical protein
VQELLLARGGKVEVATEQLVMAQGLAASDLRQAFLDLVHEPIAIVSNG